MKTWIVTIGILLAVVAGTGFALSTQGSAPQKVGGIQRWEYMILGDWVNLFGETIGTSSEGLAAAGNDGWEAVAVYPNGATLLKRPKR